MITIETQATAWTCEGSLGQCQLLAVATLRTVLACIGWIYRYIQPTSICFFVGKVCSKLRPCCISDAFGKAMIMHHAIDGQVFHGDHSTSIDELATFLMGKIATPISNTCMHLCHNQTALPPFRRAFECGRQLALGPFQIFLIGMQELRTGGTFARREGSETEQPYINPYSFARRWEGLCLHFTDNRHVPFVCGRMSDGAGFGRAFQGAMLDHAQRANLRQLQDAISQLTAVTILRKGHRIVPTVATKTWIARLFP